MGALVWHPGEIHPNQAPQPQHLGAPYICGSMRKGFKGSIQAKGNVVNADTHLVPTPPATQGSSSRSARPQGGCILSGGSCSLSVPLRTWGTQRPQPLLCSADQDLGFAHTAGRLRGSGRRGDSGTGELGNVWSCEWLGAPWREAPSGEAPRCTTSEGGAGRPAHLAGTRLLQDDPRGLYTLLSPLTAPTLQLQFTAGCSGGLPLPTLSCVSGLGQVCTAEFQGLRFEKLKQDHKYKHTAISFQRRFYGRLGFFHTRQIIGC